MDHTQIKQIKNRIEESLNSLELEQAYELIQEYEKLCPHDMELQCFYCIYFLYSGSYQEALEYALAAVKQYPTNVDVLYNVSAVYEAMGDRVTAISMGCG